MSTQQDIYAAGSESRPPMLNKENYVPWSSRLLRYAKSRPNGKLIHNSILNGPYVKRMIAKPDITDPTTAMNMALALMAKAFKLNYSTPTNNNQQISSNPRNRQIAQPGMNMGQDRQMQMIGGNGEN
nr:ribonuclease H-like domain-containing protein [Tanacetum cinerariifolium]